MTICTQIEAYTQVPSVPTQNPIQPILDTTTVKGRDSIPYNFNSSQTGSLFLNPPKNAEVTYDSESQKYIVREKIGGYFVGQPKFISDNQ